MNDKVVIRKFVKACTSTFEAFQYSCTTPKTMGCTWELVATKSNGEKVYAVVCSPRVGTVRNNIRIAQKKIPEDTKLVVVTEQFTEDEQKAAEKSGYALVTLDEMKRCGLEMLATVKREREEGKEMTEEELNDLISTREKVF